MSGRKHCSLCRVRVWVAQDGTETCNNGKQKKPHHHKRPYELIVEVDEPYEYRYWHDVAHFPG